MPPPPLPHDERLNRLRLFRTENVGPITFRRVLDHFGSAAAALDALPDLARRGGRRAPLKLCSRAAAEREMETLERLGARLLVWGDGDYPPLLAAIEDAPPVLALKGAMHLLAKPAVALVGARNASLNGRRFAQALARDIGQAGPVVVSGLARGIDAAAHEGALATGTVAVVAGGIDVVYPEENRALHERVAAEGVIVAEMPPGTLPQARHFPQRNRIIAGLSLATIVVEAALRSGSLITARLAGEQGREVMAVPGSPLDPRARGANDLIRHGATLVETAADVLDALPEGRTEALEARPAVPFGAGASANIDSQDVDKYREFVIECLGPSPVPVDEILRRCQCSPAVVLFVLLELELAGRLERHAGNAVSLL